MIRERLYKKFKEDVKVSNSPARQPWTGLALHRIKEYEGKWLKTPRKLFLAKRREQRFRRKTPQCVRPSPKNNSYRRRYRILTHCNAGPWLLPRLERFRVCLPWKERGAELCLFRWDKTNLQGARLTLWTIRRYRCDLDLRHNMRIVMKTVGTGLVL